MVSKLTTLLIGAPAIKKKKRLSSVRALNLSRKGIPLLKDQIGSMKNTRQLVFQNNQSAYKQWQAKQCHLIEK